MTKQILIEGFGYLGSLLVLVSFLMTSVFKLRVVNTVGSVIFMIYAFIIKSYPTAFMNLCLVIINLRFLWKMSKTDREYDIFEPSPKDSMLKYFINRYQNDINACFPGIEIKLEEVNKAYVVLAQDKPAGITLGILKGDNLKLELDYTIPEYRDFSIGTSLFRHLSNQGIKRIIYDGPVENHLEYLNSQGFVKKDGQYVKEL